MMVGIGDSHDIELHLISDLFFFASCLFWETYPYILSVLLMRNHESGSSAVGVGRKKGDRIVQHGTRTDKLQGKKLCVVLHHE